MLDNLIRQYADLQKQQEELKQRADGLKQQIITKMTESGVLSTKVDDITARINAKESFKYDDEVAIIKYLKENGYGLFIEEKIKSVPLNAELRKGKTLTESLKPMYTKTTTNVLVIKRS